MQLHVEPSLLWIQGATCIRSFGLLAEAASCTIVQWQGRREKSGGAAGHFFGYLCEAGFDAADTAMKQQDFSCTSNLNTA